MKIIAEVGSNFKSFEDCKNAISLAKAVGADAVKFQLYTHEELYGFHGHMAGVMPRDWIPKLADKAKATGIEFLCTAFSKEGLRVVDPFVSTHKLASSEMCHVDMLAVLKLLKKPVLVSTGGQTEAEVRAVAKILGEQATFLYCEAAYPARHVDMRKMAVLKVIAAGYGSKEVGFSDHTTDVFTTPMAALASGAAVLEKHFNPFSYSDTPDAPHSLTTDDFRLMVRALRGEDAPVFQPTVDEQPMLLRHKRRLMITKSVARGDKLVYNSNYGVFRSKENDTFGMHPGAAHTVNGKRMLVARKPGSPLGPGDIAND